MKITYIQNKTNDNLFTITFKDITLGKVDALLNALNEWSKRSPIGEDLYQALKRVVEEKK